MVRSFSILLFLIFDTQRIGHLLIRKATEINRLKLWKDSVRLDHPEGIGAGITQLCNGLNRLAINRQTF